ncbi:MAG TPA: DUF997 family protein [Pirellulales bacterium]|nr:DUF997 family protein [Pirellulales bacterium]
MSATEDPIVRSGRREALAALVIWLAAMTYTVGYCYLFGYRSGPASMKLIWGVPDWVLWGVVAPWTACTIAAGVLAFAFMADADLGEERAESDDLFAPAEQTDE